MFRKTAYMDWGEYKEKIEFLEYFFWQQAIRKANINA